MTLPGRRRRPCKHFAGHDFVLSYRARVLFACLFNFSYPLATLDFSPSMSAVDFVTDFSSDRERTREVINEDEIHGKVALFMVEVDLDAF